MSENRMTQLQSLDRCWILLRRSTCIVQLGKFGDLLLLFPAFRLMFQRSQIEPVVMVSKEFASVFDGISYAEPWVVNLDWWQGISKARRMADNRFEHVIVPQYWNDVEARESVGVNGEKTWNVHGISWKVEGDSPDFGTAMWNRLGFSRAQMLSEPLILDRRSHEREAELVKRHIHPKKRTILYNFTGICSPFGYVPEMMRVLNNYRSSCEFVDLGKIRAYRIYDLLGLYDQAAGLITIDTSTAHLAPASRVPTLWFTVDSTGTSAPRGNVAMHCKYSETPKRLKEITDLLDRWATS